MTSILTPFRVFLLLMAPAAGLAVAAMTHHVPLGDLPGLVPPLAPPEGAAFPANYVHFALLPRAAVALLAGAALGLAGTLFQQILRNPLAEPATLGALPGAHLAVVIVTLAAPAAGGLARDGAALGGAAVAVALVFAIAWRHRLAPVTLIMAGLIVSLTASATSVLLGLFNFEYLRGVFIWASGSLVQNDWSAATALAWRLALLAAIVAPVVRPLTIAGLNDAGARSLGVPLRRLRLLALAAATGLSAIVAAAVGVIGFVGLAAPHLARLSGATSFAARLVWAPLFGAALLLLTDGVVLMASTWMAEVPTGTVTALLGAPLLILLIRRMPATEAGSAALPPPSRLPPAGPMALAFGGMLLAVAGASLFSPQAYGDLSPLTLAGGRWPRLLAAATAGGMLALAGTVLQRVTANPLASPEVLGVSSGAALGTVAVLFLAPAPTPGLMLLAGAAGAALIFPVLLLLARRVDFAPGHVLLCGVALGTLFSGIVSVVVASGDPRAMHVLVWMTGPTFRATAVHGLAGAALLAVGLPAVLMAGRWLALLPLGATTARALGMPVGAGRLLLLLLAGLLTAGATLIVGPLSFVGLMAPHMARLAGCVRPASHATAAMLLGAAIMVAADGLGRSLHAPYELPAGILATFIGAPYFLWLLARRP